MNPVAECRNLTVRYGRKTALDAVSLAVPQGGVCALLGRNGAGKSSLIRCLLGQQKPQAGDTRLFQEDAWLTRARAMARVGVVPEEPDAPPRMKAGRVVDFCAALYPRWDHAGVWDRLERCRVPMDTPAGKLSKGQKAQLSLALALGSHPELLVLDDPTLGLDAVARRALYEELLVELADRGTTVFIATHDLAGIEGIADRVAILKEGGLFLDESLETLKERFRKLRIVTEVPEKVYDAFRVLQAQRIGNDHEILVSNYDDDVFRDLLSSGVIQGQAEAVSLEDFFIAMAGKEAV